MEKGSGALCFLPKGTSMLMVACVNDWRKGEFSSAASALQFSHPALKCISLTTHQLTAVSVGMDTDEGGSKLIAEAMGCGGPG